MKAEELLRDLLPALEERDGSRALFLRIERALIDTQNSNDRLEAQNAELRAQLVALLAKESQVNVSAPEVIVSPVLQSAPGSRWRVEGKDGNKAFSFTVTKE